MLTFEQGFRLWNGEHWQQNFSADATEWFANQSHFVDESLMRISQSETLCLIFFFIRLMDGDWRKVTAEPGGRVPDICSSAD